jgi:RNA polymerase sigma-70 factor (ECF subfamily)
VAWQASPRREDDDPVLIRRVAAKDRQAFETLYYRYARRVHRYVSKFIKQPELAEEVLDDVMLVIWRKAWCFDHSSRLSTWILGIAHNKAMKARTRSARATAEALPPILEWSTAEDPASIMARRELGHILTRALDALSPAQRRAVVELTLYRGRSYREIAAITGRPVNTVKTRMFHARRLLQLLRGLGWPQASGQGEESARPDPTPTAIPTASIGRCKSSFPGTSPLPLGRTSATMSRRTSRPVPPVKPERMSFACTALSQDTGYPAGACPRGNGGGHDIKGSCPRQRESRSRTGHRQPL